MVRKIIDRKIHLDSKNTEYELILKTISGKPLGQIPQNAITEISKKINSSHTISLKVPKYYMDLLDFSQKTYPLYSALKNERQLELNGKDIFIIKSVEITNDDYIEVKAKSKEIRLKEIDISLEDTSYTLIDKIDDKDNIVLSDYLYSETGWKIQATDFIRYEFPVEPYINKYKKILISMKNIKDIQDKNKTSLDEIMKRKELIEKDKKELSEAIGKDIEKKAKQLREDGFELIKERIAEKKKEIEGLIKKIEESNSPSFDIDKALEELKGTPKIRHIESVNKKWLDFLEKDVCSSFDCCIDYDTINKIVILYDEIELENHIGLYLSKDNYIKSLEKEYNTDKLVTRMVIEGNENIDIISATCTGEKYIENFSYFMEINEMSLDLKNALTKYYKMVKKREPTWKLYADEIVNRENQKNILGKDFIHAEKTLYMLNDKLEIYNVPPKEDKELIGKLAKEITKQRDERDRIKSAIEKLEEDIRNLTKSRDNIVELCKKPTATDDDGKLIFTTALLDELKEYIYTETYKNDSFLTEYVEDLIVLSKKKLLDKSYPTRKWNIDVANFLDRIKTPYGVSWNGDLSLGDLVVLYDRETDSEEFTFLNEYKHMVRDNKLKITLSNKKTEKEDGLIISDYLTNAKNALRDIDSNRYLNVLLKYNRMNVPKEFISKYNLPKKKRPDGTVIN